MIRVTCVWVLGWFPWLRWLLAANWFMPWPSMISQAQMCIEYCDGRCWSFSVPIWSRCYIYFNIYLTCTLKLLCYIVHVCTCICVDHVINLYFQEEMTSPILPALASNATPQIKVHVCAQALLTMDCPEGKPLGELSYFHSSFIVAWLHSSHCVCVCVYVCVCACVCACVFETADFLCR